MEELREKLENKMTKEVNRKIRYVKSEDSKRLDDLAKSVSKKSSNIFSSFGSEKNEIINLQRKEIKELKRNIEVITKTSTEIRNKLINANNEIASQKKKFSILLKEYNSLKGMYNSLTEKFNLLYKHGREFFDQKIGKLNKIFDKFKGGDFEN